MGVHQRILPQLVESCASIHPACAVVLIGSVAQGTECPTSDLDLNLIFPGGERPATTHPYIGDDNRWQLVVKDHVEGIRIDVAWETETALLGHVTGDGVRGCWPISNGRVLHDPAGIAEPAVAIARRWFDDHADVRAQCERAYAEAKRRQRDARR